MPTSGQKIVQIFDISKVVLNLCVDTCAEGQGSSIVSTYMLSLTSKLQINCYCGCIRFCKTFATPA